MNTDEIESQMDKLADAVKAGSMKPNVQLAPHVMLHVKQYNSPEGRGFVIECLMRAKRALARRVKNYGPLTRLEVPWNHAHVRLFWIAILDDLYSELPMEVQIAFAREYVTIKDFVNRDQKAVARGVLASLQVPPELEPVKQQFLSLLS